LIEKEAKLFPRLLSEKEAPAGQLSKPKLELQLYNRDKTDNGHITMKITKDEVLYVADLARLELDDASIDKFAGQIGDVLEYVAKLNEVDTEGLRPTSHAISLTNAFREDEQRPPLDRELALANAPEKEDGNFVVPKIIE
jgi:aspartyl-tRNA(Asn)/glutamyl-tRNA(Gln) amidotransferase subunit C